MESTVVDFFQFSENSDMTVGSTNKNPPYVSYIKINGKPILPPLLNEEKRREIQRYKQKAIEMELKLAKQKKPAEKKINSISSDILSVVTPSRQFTPARPVSLNLAEVDSGKAFVSTKSWTDMMLSNYASDEPTNCEFISSQKKAKALNKPFKSTLEQQLASKDSIIIKNKLNKYQQSPIIEEQILEKYIDSDSDSKKDRKRWSPLKIDSINSLKIELPSKDTEEKDENLETSFDESQNTPDTITHSPNLMRQNSYTLLTPSPALLSFLESQNEFENMQKTQSGRKTWDLTKAKKNWDSNSGALGKSSDEDDEPEIQFLNKSNCSMLDSFQGSCNDPNHTEYSNQNSINYDSESAISNSSRSIPKIGKIKCKLKERKMKSSKNVPSPKTIDTVPMKDTKVNTSQDMLGMGVQTDLSGLSNLLLKMKVDYERQKKELEEKQRLEMKKLEVIFQAKEVELLSKVNQWQKKSTKSIYSQSSGDLAPQEPEMGMMGDGNCGLGNIQKSNSTCENYIAVHFRRPHSAKDFHPQNYSQENETNRRTRSMDFNQGNQDTDLDVSFQDDFIQGKDGILNNENTEYIIESDSMSNFSSHSSTISSDNRHDPLVYNCKMFHKISSEEYAKYNQAATVITAAARGFLTRRLLRTAHVQGLITTLKDAISCATQLHTAPDIADSDIDLMRRLSRQIEAAWDEVYGVFFNTETSTRLQLIAADRERLRAANAKTPVSTVKHKSISSATRKSLDRKKGMMSKSHTSNGLNRVRMCTKMTASYPSPYFSQKQK